MVSSRTRVDAVAMGLPMKPSPGQPNAPWMNSWFNPTFATAHTTATHKAGCTSCCANKNWRTSESAQRPTPAPHQQADRQVKVRPESAKPTDARTHGVGPQAQDAPTSKCGGKVGLHSTESTSTQQWTSEPPSNHHRDDQDSGEQRSDLQHHVMTTPCMSPSKPRLRN